MTESFAQQIRGKASSWWSLMGQPGIASGLMDTAASNSLVTDSAAAASAWSTGKRIPNGQICVDDTGKKLESIGETLVKAGAKLGLVSTATITHATPAGFAANSVNRSSEDLIAPQYLNRADVILGGGSEFFDAQKRSDGRDLFAEYKKEKYDVVRTRDAMLQSKSPKLLGTFCQGHLPYTIDRNQDKELQKQVPTLAEMSEVALNRFLSGQEPFLLQIEGARIDHAAHANDIGAILHDQLAFDDALAKVVTLVEQRDDILVVVTSDHGNANPALNGTGAGYRQTNQHFMQIAALKTSHEQFFAKWRRLRDGSVKQFGEMVHENFGFKPTKEEAEAITDSLQGKQVTEWHHALNNPVGLMGQIVGNHTGTGWTGVTHTSDPTQVTAVGPGCGSFHGLVRNDHVRDILLGRLLG